MHMANFGHISMMLVLFCCINKAASGIYWITTNSSSLQTTHLTLSQFAAYSDDFLHLNTTLVFLPGTHYLTGSLTISNLVNFSMTSQSTTAHLVCTKYSDNIHFSHSQYIHMANLKFIGCGGNLVDNVVELIVQYVLFQGNDNSGTALNLVDTTAQIVSCTFSSNRNGRFTPYHYLFYGYVGGAIVATNCKLDITQANFQEMEQILAELFWQNKAS